MTRHWSAALPKNACSNAVEWARSQKSAAAAWKSCERGDWMLWLLGKLSGEPESASRKKLVLAACSCARLSLKYVRKGEDRPRIAIETAERYARGEVLTMDDVRKAAAAASASAASAAAAAAYVAYVADAAAAAAAYVARKTTFKKCADIVREHYPQPPRLSAQRKAS